MTISIIKNIAIFCLIVAGIFFFLKKFTVYRCPKCQSRHVVKVNDENAKQNEISYFCQECKHVVKKTKI